MIKKFISLAAVAASIFGCSGSDTVAADGDGHIDSGVKKGTMTDLRDGQVYKTVKIGTQTWMAENLNYDPGDVSDMGIYAWSGCYDDDPANCQKYGRLYTWEVAMDKAGCGDGTYCNNSYEGTQGVCPSGWHLPSIEDWRKLLKPMAIGVDSDSCGDGWSYYGAGVEMKTVDGWYENSKSIAGTNASGFSVLPAGSFSFIGDGRYDGHAFTGAGEYAWFWSASEYEIRYIFNDRDYVGVLRLGYYDDTAELILATKSVAGSVRCVRN